jgi:hypothetical protein
MNIELVHDELRIGMDRFQSKGEFLICKSWIRSKLGGIEHVKNEYRLIYVNKFIFIPMKRFSTEKLEDIIEMRQTIK